MLIQTFPRKISKMETEYKKASMLANCVIFLFCFLHRGEEINQRMDTVEHTASTILVVQTVTFFYSILELWLFTNHMDICGCSSFFFSFCYIYVPTYEWALQVRFCHMDICGGLSCVFFVFLFFFGDKWQASQKHRHDPLTGPLWWWILKLDDQLWSRRMDKIKDGLCFVRVQGDTTLRGDWEGVPQKHSHPALTNSPMHFCSFKLWGTILRMGAQLQQEDCVWKKKKKSPNSHLLCITIFLYYFLRVEN